MTIYYHVSDKEYPKLTIIPPGEWGRRSNGKYFNEKFNEILLNNSDIIIDVIFEKIRKEVNPKLVSRFDCNFVFKTIENAKLFLRLYRDSAKCFIYEIEVEEGVKTFDGDFTIVTKITPFSINQIERAAKDYWTGKKETNFIETLIEGSVKVIRKVE